VRIKNLKLVSNFIIFVDLKLESKID